MRRSKRETWVIGPVTRTLSHAWASAERRGLTPLNQRQSLVDLTRERDRLLTHERRLTVDLQRALRSGHTWRIAKLDALRGDCQARCQLVMVEIARRLDMRTKRDNAIKTNRKLHASRSSVVEWV